MSDKVNKDTVEENGKGCEENDRKKRSRGRRGRKDKANSNTSAKYSPDNALDWYTKYPNLIQGSAQVSFPNRPGMTALAADTLSKNTGTSATTVSGFMTVPGVLAIEWMPAYGFNEVGNSQNPLTIAANETYAKIRSNFSGDLDVDPPDIMLYQLAIDSIYALIAKYKRIFRVVNAYSPDNYMTPDGILNAMGFSAAQVALLRKQKMDIFNIINTLVLEIRKFRCPGHMDVFNRHYWLNDNIYTDADSINSQFFLFNMIGYYKLSEVSTDITLPPVTLQMQSTSAANYGTSDIAQAMYNECHDCIQRLAKWSDSYTINGYLLKAFDPRSFFYTDEIDYGEVLLPVFSPEVLTQIENARALPTQTVTNTTITYTLNDNVMSCTPTCMIPQASASVATALTMQAFNIAPSLNIHADAPNVADVVIASRLQPILRRASSFDTGSATAQAIYCGTEIVVDMKLTVSNPTSMGSWLRHDIAQFIGVTDPGVVQIGGTSNVSQQLYYSALMQQFRMHPIQFVVYLTGASSAAADFYVAPLGDTYNFAFVKKDVMQLLNRNCVLSELDAYATI